MIMISDTPDNDTVSCPIYALKLCIISGRNFHLLDRIITSLHHEIMHDIWISFTFLGITTQSSPFRAVKEPDFLPIITEFRLYGSSSEIYQRLTSPGERNITILVCTQGSILSTTVLDISKELFPSSDLLPQKHSLDSASTKTGSLTFDDRTTIEGLNDDDKMTLCYALSLTNKSNEDKTCINEDHGDNSYGWVQKAMNLQLNRMEQKEKKLLCMEEKFNEHVRAKEKELQDHFKQKDRMLRSLIEQEACNIEHELLAACDSSRNSYKELENKLREHLSRVEAKERELETVVSNNEATLSRRSAELELKMKLVCDECEHKIDMEKNKVKQAEARLLAIEKELESSLKRGRKVESEVDELHHQLRNSDESKLHNEISLLKGKIIELEAMLSSERHEKDLLMQEKENYRGSANKLAKLLQRERESNDVINNKKNMNENNRINELQKIQRELKLISSTKQELV